MPDTQASEAVKIGQTDKETVSKFVDVGLRTEAWVFIGVILLLLVLLIFIIVRGTDTVWFQRLGVNFNWTTIVILWIFFFLLAAAGIFAMLYYSSKYRGTGITVMFGCIFAIGLLLTTLWVTLLLFGQDLYLSLVLQVITVLYYMWMFYMIFSYGGLACLLFLPLLGISMYTLIAGTQLMYYASQPISNWDYFVQLFQGRNQS